MRPRLEEEAHARMLAGRTVQPVDPAANLQQGTGSPKSVNAKIGELAGVSERTVADFRKVMTEGGPAIKDAVASGQVAISDAVALIKETKEPKEQAEAVRAKREGKGRTATQAARSQRTGRSDSQNGAPVFKDQIIQELIGKLARAFSERSKAYGGDSPEYRDVRQALNHLEAAWNRWQLARGRSRAGSR
jgi:hypothetical protein